MLITTNAKSHLTKYIVEAIENPYKRRITTLPHPQKLTQNGLLT